MKEHPKFAQIQSFREGILKLLKEGKRSKHPEFQVLFEAYGRETVTKVAKELLANKLKSDIPEAHLKARALVEEVFGPCELMESKKI